MSETKGAMPRAIGNVFKAIDGAAIRVQQQRCAKVRNRNVSCMKCADACTSGCIAFENGELRIRPEKCVGCGTCATVCPTCALEACNPSDAELVAACLRANRNGEVAIACSLACEALEGVVRSDAVASVVCAGRVDESLLATLAAKGVSRVTVLCGNCEMCAQRHGRATAEMVTETYRALAEVWGIGASVVVTQELPVSLLEQEVSLQQVQARLESFFSRERACVPVRDEAGGRLPDSGCSSGAKRGEGEDAGKPAACSTEQAAAAQVSADENAGYVDLSSPAAEAVDQTHGAGMRFYWNSGHSRAPKAGTMHVMKDGTLPHFIPDRRERLLDALSTAGAPKQKSVACRLWGAVVIDGSKCVSCRMCATFCPTSAIRKFDEADGTMGVEHYPGDCVKCGSCRDICPADAIVLLDDVKTDWLMDGQPHRYRMSPRPVSLNDNPHQILDTMRLGFDGDLFER